MRLECTGRLEKLGTKWVTIVDEMTNLRHGELAATLRSVAVGLDTKARKAVAFPDAWRRKAEGVLAQGVVRGSSA